MDPCEVLIARFAAERYVTHAPDTSLAWLLGDLRPLLDTVQHARAEREEEARDAPATQSTVSE